ncbi:hypothetical protein AB0N89_38450 [Amycolatopsis sp. NPDC089917]|uniref:hypothetical protein n=1 Tax=Amycolatopsis sp. NPDC089917 TaxID=3155187 RepID=UPI0034498370
MNVPGPFSTGVTDVYRQPATQAEVLNLVAAARQDPYRGYACDGDSRWTVETVRDWWRDRARVVEYLESLLPGWSASDRSDEREAAQGLTDFADYLAAGLDTDLRKYLFRLEEGHYPKSSGVLPDLR